MTTVTLGVSPRGDSVGTAYGRSSYLHKSALAAHWLQTFRDRLRKLVAWFGVAIAVSMILFSNSSHAAIVFQEDFSGTSLNVAKWRELAFHGQRISVSGGTAIFNSQNYADTCGRYAFSGDNGIVIEARMRGPSFNRDTHVEVIEAVTGDVIIAGDTSYSPGGLYTAASGQFYSYQGGTAISTAEYREYRFSVAGDSLVIARGDTLANLTESRSVTLASSIVGKVFYLRIGTGGPVHQPGEFDWVRVNGTLTSNPNACSTAGLLGLTVSSVTPSTAVLDTPTIFQVSGYQLPSGLGFTLGDCTPADSEVFDATTSDTLRKFRCTPRGSPGLKYGRVKSSPTGATLANFNVDVVANLGANEVASFVFDGPISDQQTGQPFLVRVRAVNSSGATAGGFNGVVRLSRLPVATLSQSTVQLVNGEWSGHTAVLTSGRGKLMTEYLRADRVSAYGSTNVFEVSAASDRQSFTVGGRTLPTVDEVRLINQVTNATAVAQVNTDGQFVFSNVPKGVHQVQVRKTGFRQITQIDPFDVSKDLTLPTIQVTDGSRYVLLVPGMMGSTLKNTVGGVNREDVWGRWFEAPSLRANSACDAEKAASEVDLLTLYDPFVATGNIKAYDGYAMGWRRMTSSLEAQGFVVYQVPWDWRCTAKQASDAYLKPTIAKLRQLDPAAEISVVAHSMGGLVTREFIQSTGYDREISKFVMLGTPNAGGTKAYFLMEGGDPSRADTWYVPVYENAIESIYKTQGNFTLVGKSATFKRDFIRRNVPGGFDLMPVYPYLRRGQLIALASDAYGSVDKCIEQLAAAVESIECNGSNLDSCNANLRSLNGDPPNANPNLNRFISFTQSPTGKEVRTKLYLSNSERDTDYIVNYCSSSRSNEAYSYGLPAVMSTDNGDGTVRSALGLAFTGSMQDVGGYGSHPGMPGRLAGSVATLLSGAVPRTFATAKASDTVALVSTNGQLQFRGDSAVDLMLQLPDGAVTGTSDQGVVTEIPDRSEVVNFSLLRAINVDDPINGRYQLTLRAPTTMQRTLQTIRVTSGSAVNAGDVWVRFLPRQTSSLLQFDLAKEALAPIVPLDSVLPPTDLIASRNTTGVTLSWTASADPAITGYRAFVRENAKSVFEMLGETTGTSFATNLQWASSEDDLLHFAVLSVNANGDESFVKEGNYTTNESYIAASFASSATNQSLATGTTLPVAVSFADQSKSSSPITSWSWDFNGDGSPDSTVQNPTYFFDSYGQHTVTLTVTSDDGTDTRIQAFAVNLVPCAPLQQSMTCTLDVNGDGRADSRDGLLILRRMLGFSGSALTDGVVNASCGAVSTQATIADFVDNQLANGHYNIDGSIGGDSAASSGLLIYRALQGLTDDAVTANAIRPGATRTTWTGAGQIREYLNTQCGAGL